MWSWRNKVVALVKIYESLFILLRHSASVQIWIPNSPASRKRRHPLGWNKELQVKMSRFQRKSCKNISVAFIVCQIYFIAILVLYFPPASSILLAPHVCKMKCRNMANKQKTPPPPNRSLSYCLIQQLFESLCRVFIPGRLRVLLLGVTHFWATKHEISQRTSLQCENDIVWLGRGKMASLTKRRTLWCINLLLS